MIINAQLKVLAVLPVSASERVGWIRVRGLVLLFRQKLFGVSFLEFANRGTGFFCQGEQLLGDFNLTFVIAANFGNDFWLPVDKLLDHPALLGRDLIIHFARNGSTLSESRIDHTLIVLTPFQLGPLGCFNWQ